MIARTKRTSDIEGTMLFFHSDPYGGKQGMVLTSKSMGRRSSSAVRTVFPSRTLVVPREKVSGYIGP